jgi:hydrogenase/urease accessory protein HupE
VTRWIAVAGLAWAGSALPAEAHLVQTGFGSFYDGVAHVAVTPPDLLVVLAVALLAGASGAASARAALFALAAAWLAGGALGGWLPSGGGAAWATTLTFAGFGLLVALNAKLRPVPAACLAAGAGVLHGWVNGAALAASGGFALQLAGVVATVFTVAALVSARVVGLCAPWSKTVVRVAGSWIAAAGMLMLGWLIRG